MGRKDNPTVLIVGENSRIKEICAEKQSLPGCSTILAANVQEAFQAAEKLARIDLLLTDIMLDNSYNMPEINGMVFARQFCRLYPNADVLFMIP